MIGAYLRRGLVAGLLAGLLAGAVGVLAGEPRVDAAVAREAALAAAQPAPAGMTHTADQFVITRKTQKFGLVAGTILVGLALGSVFAILAAWAVGRVQGDAWARSLKLGLAIIGAIVVLPLIKYPPNPPSVGDPSTIGTRTAGYLGVLLIGLVLAALAWAVNRQLRTAGRLSGPARQVVVGAGVVLLATLLLAGLPGAEAAPAGFPADLLWRFRLSSAATQLSMIGGVAVAFGLLSARAERRERPDDRVRAAAT